MIVKKKKNHLFSYDLTSGENVKTDWMMTGLMLDDETFRIMAPRSCDGSLIRSSSSRAAGKLSDTGVGG